MSALDLVLAVFSVVAAVAALAAVTSRQVVHAALWLVLTLGALAGVYLVLGAEVVALVQLLVYVGAVVVLVLFALMLTRAPIGVRDDLDVGRGRRVVAVLAGLATAGLLGATLLAAFGTMTTTVDGASGLAAPLGRAIFTGWVLPFELLSVLLLAALVGAVAVARTAGRAAGATPAVGGTPETGAEADEQ